MAIPDPTMRIYYGAPGTGKTYRAAREAIRIIDGAISSDPGEVLDRHRQLLAGGQIVWVTFHPSYSYEDFVEGFRPRLTDSGDINYVVVDGPFKRACASCGAADPLSSLRVGDRIGKDGRYEVLHIDPSGVVLQSEAGRKDEVNPEVVQYVDRWTIQRLIDTDATPAELSIPGSRADERVQVAQKTGLPTTFFTNSSAHRAVLERVIDSGATGGSQPVVLVIDEINRADLSRVFGELMTLVEVDKRQGAAEERAVVLPYSQAPFSVPRELSIVGTMNTADRSLAVVDVALRRRFEFEELEPEPSLLPMSYAGLNLQELLLAWNLRITALASRDVRLGHSELMEAALERVREANGWSDTSDGRQRAVAHVVRTRVVALLLEYFHDDWRKADVVLGRFGLFEEVDLQAIAELASDVLDLGEQSSFLLPLWWNPSHTEWDAGRFVEALTG
jgi:5-methylcytosine-specific restriction enzyme B